LVNELNLDPKTKVKVKNIDVELIEGDLEEKPWLIESEGKNYVLLEEEQYDKLIILLRNILEENLEYKIEAKIMNEFPIDFDDVKLVVKKEMEEENLPLGISAILILLLRENLKKVNKLLILIWDKIFYFP
jgi:hypothetical protein